MMKQIYIFFALTFSIANFAQDPILTNNTWYLLSLNIDSEIHLTPDNFEIPFVSNNFIGTVFLSEICESGFLSHVNYISTDIFEFIDFTPASGLCENNENEIYKNLYINYFQNEITSQFNYNIITESNGSKTLTITNNNNDIAIYTNNFFTPPPQELVNNNWYLHNLIINGIDNIPPNNNELTAIDINFNHNLEISEFFLTRVCDGLSGIQNFDIVNSKFLLYDITLGLVQCSIVTNDDYQNLYFNFFLNNDIPNPFEYSGPFNYQILEDGSNKTLTITAINGDQAIYGNNVLSTQGYINTLFTIYPNPTTDNIIINEKTDIKIENINIYNTLGKLIIKTKNKTIDLSNFENGLYLLNIKLKNGNQLTKKIIKQ